MPRPQPLPPDTPPVPNQDIPGPSPGDIPKPTDNPDLPGRDLPPQPGEPGPIPGPAKPPPGPQGL